MRLFFNHLLQRLLLSKRRPLLLPGGGMEGNETKEECLYRELLEELGWAIKIDDISVMRLDIFMQKRKIYII